MAFDFGSFLKPLGGVVSSLAPVAGTVIGGLLGGPSGAMSGGSLGSALGNIAGTLMGNNPTQGGMAPQYQGQPQSPYQQYQGQPQSPYGRGGYPGMMPQMQTLPQMTQGALNAAMPSQYQGMTFGQMANQLGGAGGQAINQALDPQAAQSGLGEALMSSLGGIGSSLGNYMQGRYGQNLPFAMPTLGQMADMSPQSVTQGFANRGQQYLEN